MRIPPFYKITSEILNLIAKIDSYRHFFASVDIPILVKDRLQKISLLKSALFSARIEGNPLTFENIETSSNKQKKIEVFNILEALSYLKKQLELSNKITIKLILSTHSIIMKNLGLSADFFRKEMSAIFNQAGVAIYLPPAPQKINRLIKRLLQYMNNNQEKFPLIQALLAHLVFEKIHPFIDGNGRIGRLLIYAALKSKGYDFNLFVPYEEYLDCNKSDYYYYLDVGLKDTNSYLLFMLKGFLTQLERLKESFNLELNKKEELLLLPPRQEEIYQIIKDHKVVSFDFIKRRFLKVPSRTLRYDLKKLVQDEYVAKIGKTKGSYYRLKKK